MNRQTEGMTLIEAAVALFIITVMFAILIPMLAHAREESRKKTCQENLSMLGKASAAYTQNNSDYFMFSWGPAGGDSPRKKDAMTSLAILYPLYIDDTQYFRCPSTTDRPWVRTNVPSPVGDSDGDGKTAHKEVLPGQAYVWSNRNYTLMESSYGYDCRIYPAAVTYHANMADMDGSNCAPSKSDTANHRNGHHVLGIDGSVVWKTIAFCSIDPNDNIFTEDPWQADTDSFISDNTPPGSDETPGAFNDLTVSYDPYKDLHP